MGLEVGRGGRWEGHWDIVIGRGSGIWEGGSECWKVETGGCDTNHLHDRCFYIQKYSVRCSAYLYITGTVL